MSHHPRMIGVSGIVSHRQQEHIEKFAEQEGMQELQNPTVLMAGIQATDKSVFNPDESKYTPHWHPYGTEGLTNAAKSSEITQPFIHVYHSKFCPNKDDITMSDLDHFLYLLKTIDECTKHYRKGWQLNQLPLSSELSLYAIEKIRDLYTSDALVLQLHENKPPDYPQVVGRLKPDYTIIDGSGGQGKPFKTHEVKEVIRRLRDYSDTNIIVAGGLGPTSMDKIHPFLQQNLNFSIDAEGQLRTGKTLDLQKVQTYLQRSIQLFKTNEK